jgi:hypothetical protein
MSDLDVDAIEARAQATPYGPWEVGEWVKGLGYAIWAGDGDLLVYADPPGGHYLGREVEDLIVNARPDILALVSRIRELEAIVRKVSEYSVADKTLIGVAGDLQEIVGSEFPSEWGWGGSEIP